MTTTTNDTSTGSTTTSLIDSPTGSDIVNTGSVLIPVSHTIAETDPSYLEALANTARDVKETIISSIMT